MFKLLKQRHDGEILYYRKPQQHEHKKYAEKICDVFSKVEPICQVLKMDKEQMQKYQFDELVSENDLSLSVIAIRLDKNGTQNIVGGAMILDMADLLNEDQPQEDIEQIPQNLRIVMDFLGNIEHKFADKYGYPKRGEVAYFFAAFLDKELRNCSFSYNFVLEQEKHYQKLGYKKIVGIFTGKQCQSLGKVMGFKEVYSVKYKDYTYNGEHVLKDVKVDSCMLMEKDITEVNTVSYQVKNTAKLAILNRLYKLNKFVQPLLKKNKK